MSHKLYQTSVCWHHTTWFSFCDSVSTVRNVDNNILKEHSEIYRCKTLNSNWVFMFKLCDQFSVDGFIFLLLIFSVGYTGPICIHKIHLNMFGKMLAVGSSFQRRWISNLGIKWSSTYFIRILASLFCILLYSCLGQIGLYRYRN